MNSRTNRSGRAYSMGAGIAAGGLTSMGITLAGAMLSAAMISGGRIGEAHVGYCSLIIILLSSLLGSLLAAKLIKHRWVYVCTLTGVVYYGVLLSITALFFGGQYQGMGVTALLVIAGCGVSILMGMRGDRRRNPHKVKIGRH